MWVIIVTIIGVLLLSCVLFSVFAYVNRSTPQKTLTTFCTDLKSNNLHDAYQQMSTDFQSQTSEATFTSQISRAMTTVGGLKDCTVGAVNEGTTSATGTMFWAVNLSTQIVPFDTNLTNENS